MAEVRSLAAAPDGSPRHGVAPTHRAEAVLAPVQGGITAPGGFTAGAVHCGIKAVPSALDLAVLAADAPASAAALFTMNLA